MVNSAGLESATSCFQGIAGRRINHLRPANDKLQRITLNPSVYAGPAAFQVLKRQSVALPSRFVVDTRLYSNEDGQTSRSVSGTIAAPSGPAVTGLKSRVPKNISES
jgi:hypothetical protein